MKPSFCNHVNCLRAGVAALLVWGGLQFASSGFAQAADTYLNTGSNFAPWPQIDATNIVNTGSLTFLSALPWESSDTLNITNSGTMVGTPGFKFNNSPVGTGLVQPAANFVNRPPGTGSGGIIQAVDGQSPINIGVQNVSQLLPSYLFVNATNILNRGSLIVGADGWLQLEGSHIDLSRSLLQVTPIEQSALGSFNDAPELGEYVPDAGIYDVYWGQTNMTFGTPGLWNGNVATSPVHIVAQPYGATAGAQIRFVVNYADSYTNAFAGDVGLGITNADGSVTTNFMTMTTNLVKQAIFVGVPDPNIFKANLGFTDSSNPTNRFKTLGVGISVALTNYVTAQNDSSTLYFLDTLSAETNTGVLLNVVSGNTYRPANYFFQRQLFSVGKKGFGPPGASFLYEFTTNFVADGPYAGYGAQVDNLVSRAPSIPSGTETNYPGRVRVYADSLDMSRTRIRGEGEVIVNAKHLVGSSGAIVDCENLSFNLASTNGNLTVVNLARTNVNRLTGYVLAWSGVWSNTASQIFTISNNFAPVVTTTNDPSGNPVSTTNYIPQNFDYTNNFSVGYHVLMLDATRLSTTLPVTVFDLTMRSTNVVLNDNMTVVQSLLVDGQSFTLNGGLTLSSILLPNTFGPSVPVFLSDWQSSNAPSMLYFTNNGTMVVPSEAHFGDDFPTDDPLAPTSYLAFVNHGSMIAGGENIKSLYCELGGSTTVSGSLDVSAQDCRVENGGVNSGNDILMHANTLKLSKGLVTTATRLYLTVTNSFYDGGPTSSNSITVGDGFFMMNRPSGPAPGDLLGTSVQTAAGDYGPEVDHIWPAQDRGDNNTGYTNNLALGRLTPIPGAFEAAFPPLFVFNGSGSSNAIYVDYLDLSQLADYTNEIELNPNLIIYYAAARLGFQPPANSNGVPQSAEEYLDGQFGGHLRWVSSYAGANSSVDVVIKGQTVKVNRALRYSKIIDSNGNGIPNYYDADPFGLVLTGALTPAAAPKSFSISWQAAPATAYTIQFSTNWTTWQTLTTYTNAGLSGKLATVVDTNAPASGAQRFYRVVY